MKLGRDVRFGVDGVNWAFIHASHAIDALLWVNEKLILHLIKAGDGAHRHAIGELAPHTFTGNDMGHKQIYSSGALPRDDASVDRVHEGAVKIED